MAGGQLTKKGWKNIRAERILSRRTGIQRKSVDGLSAERRIALGARNQRWSPYELFFAATPP